MNTPKVVTAYLSDFRLWVLVRALPKGGHETSWCKTHDSDGPAVFVSALDAEIYRLNLHNRGDKNWRRCPLEAIDLAQMAANFGGRIVCQMVFGFSANLSGQLTLRDGNLRPLCVPLPFDLGSGPIRPVTFSFDQWVFDFMRAQWEIIDASDYPGMLERTNDLDDATLTEQALQALSVAPTTGEWEQGGDWAIFSPTPMRWHFGPQEQRQLSNLH